MCEEFWQYKIRLYPKGWKLHPSPDFHMKFIYFLLFSASFWVLIVSLFDKMLYIPHPRNLPEEVLTTMSSSPQSWGMSAAQDWLWRMASGWWFCQVAFTKCTSEKLLPSGHNQLLISSLMGRRGGGGWGRGEPWGRKSQTRRQLGLHWNVSSRWCKYILYLVQQMTLFYIGFYLHNYVFLRLI